MKNYSEQLLTNKSRTYYSGKIKDYDRGKALHTDFVYLTTNPVYAAFYAKQDGIIESYNLKSSVSIFNARSEKDYYTLRNYLLSDPENNTFTKYLDRLKDEDWTFVLNDFDKRNELARIIIGLGYDGFFNFEYTKNHKKELQRHNEYVPDFEDMPAIGVLNINSFISYKTFNGLTEFLEIDGLKEYKEHEIQNLQETIELYLHHNIPRNIIKIICTQLKPILLDTDEINNIVDNFKNDKFFESLCKLCCNGINNKNEEYWETLRNLKI